jgi:hypothetical protein
MGSIPLTADLVVRPRRPLKHPASLWKAHHLPGAVVLCRQDIKDKAGRQAVAAVAAKLLYGRCFQLFLRWMARTDSAVSP